MTPPTTFFSQEGTHRLIPSLYSRQETVLAEIADDEIMLADLVQLDGATNDRIQGERGALAGISPYELVYGIPNAHIINAAFTHSHAWGSRFNDSTRGAWYAALEFETSLAEVAYHKALRLAEIIVPGLPGERPDRDTSTYDDWLADFRAEMHTLEPAAEFADALLPEPVPACYAASQTLATRLLAEQSNGLLYPSVRRTGSLCAVCFRPALVYNPRWGVSIALTLTASDEGYDQTVRFFEQ